MKTYRKNAPKRKMTKLNNSYYPSIKKGILISNEDLRKELATSLGVDISRIGKIEVFDKDTHEVYRSIEFKNKPDA